MSEAILPIALVALLLLGIEVFRGARRPEARRLRVIRKIGGPRMSPRKKWIIIGTSGSTDFLRSDTGSKRYWNVQASAPVAGDLAASAPADDQEMD